MSLPTLNAKTQKPKEQFLANARSNFINYVSYHFRQDKADLNT
jgi:hypothetical protein